MHIYQSYQFRLYPNRWQIVMIQKTFGCTRLVYNHYLERRKKDHLTCFDMIKDLSIRNWICPRCGSYHDRDINASQNI